jgi:hypothetical protein
VRASTMDSPVLGLALSGCCCCTVRVFTRNLALEDAIERTPARLKLLHACDQWHSSRESSALIVAIMNYAEAPKVSPNGLEHIYHTHRPTMHSVTLMTS